MNPGHDSAVLCNTGSIFGSKLFYSDFLMRSSREKKKKKNLCMNEGRWMGDANKWFLINLFIFIVTQYPCHPLLRHKGFPLCEIAYASKANEKK